MDERQLLILRELGALGSVRAVAEALHVTPSAVSQQLRLLQRSARVPLTERRGRTLALTSDGAELAAAGVDVHVALEHARQLARGRSRHPRGTVSVAGFASAALAFFPSLLRRFPPSGPVSVALTDEDVAQDEFPPLTATTDVVLAHRLDHTPHWPRWVDVTPLLHEPLDVAVPRGHELAGRARITPAQAAAQSWITTHDGFPLLATLDAVSAVAGRPVDIRHRVNEFSIAVELVKAGGGLALVPRWTVPRPAGVVLRPLAGITARRHIDALHRPEQRVRPATGAVLDELAKVAARLSR